MEVMRSLSNPVLIGMDTAARMNRDSSLDPQVARVINRRFTSVTGIVSVATAYYQCEGR